MSDYILHIETATKVCSVAISLNGELLAVKETQSEQYIHGEVLNLFIQEILQEARINPLDLCAVSVSSGPGSYTGLRIGVSTVKGFCYALGIPLIQIPTLDVLHAISILKHPEKTICVMLDARRMEVYSKIWDQKGRIIKSLSADVLDENSYREFLPFVCVGDGSEKMKTVWTSNSIQYDDSIFPTAAGQVNLAYKKFKNQDFVDVAEFVPEYLKDFQSTNQLK